MRAPPWLNATASRLATLLTCACLGVGLGAVELAGQTAAPPVTPSAPDAQPVPSPDHSARGAVEAGIEAAVRDFRQEPRFKTLSEKQVRDRLEFVAGNVIFAMVHEIGHMLIAEMGLPVLGREEDAADAFATLTGLRLANALSERVLMQSARGWFLSNRRDEKRRIQITFYDEHGLDKQRAYNIVCLMVGSNPEKFHALADMTKLPADRQRTCQGDYASASWSWEKALEPHIRKPDQLKTKIEVGYADGSRYAVYAKGFREMRLLETLADHLADRFVWRGPIGLEMMSCGLPNAHWDLATRTVSVCYELAADFAEMYRDFASDQKSQRVARKYKR